LELLCRLPHPLRRLRAAGTLGYGPDLTVRSFVIRHLLTTGADLRAVLGWLRDNRGEHGPADSGMRQALILALGYSNQPQDRLLQFQPDTGALGDAPGEAIAVVLFELYRTDPDPGVHSAVDWLLRRWDLAAGGRRGYTARRGDAEGELAR